MLLAVEEADTAEDIEWLSGKIVRLRVFDDENGVMNRSVQEAQAASCWSASSPCLPARRRATGLPTAGRPGRKSRCRCTSSSSRRLAQDLGKPIQTGEFGAHMLVSLTNDGPVTIIIDSKARE